jgi:hypothetical protein
MWNVACAVGFIYGCQKCLLLRYTVLTAVNVRVKGILAFGSADLHETPQMLVASLVLDQDCFILTRALSA